MSEKKERLEQRHDKGSPYCRYCIPQDTPSCIHPPTALNRRMLSSAAGERVFPHCGTRCSPAVLAVDDSGMLARQRRVVQHDVARRLLPPEDHPLLVERDAANHGAILTGIRPHGGKTWTRQTSESKRNGALCSTPLQGMEQGKEGKSGAPAPTRHLPCAALERLNDGSMQCTLRTSSELIPGRGSTAHSGGCHVDPPAPAVVCCSWLDGW